MTKATKPRKAKAVRVTESESEVAPQAEPKAEKSSVKKVVDVIAKTLSFSDPSKLEGEVVIWKHEIWLSDLHRSQSITAPVGSVPLSVGVQNGKLFLWTAHIVDRDSDEVNYQPIDVIVAFTGSHGCKLPAGYRFLGTEQIGSLVYHVFVAAK